MDLVDEMIDKCLNSKEISLRFKESFLTLQQYKKAALEKGFRFEKTNDQLSFLFTFFRKIDKRTCYVTKYNSRALVISLTNEKQSISIFFNHFYKTFKALKDHIVIDEGFMGHPIGQDVNILAETSSNRKYLYNDKGEFLNIDGEEIMLTTDSFRHEYYKNFCIAIDNGQIDIYSDNFDPLVLEADSYKIVGDWHCLSKKNDLFYLSHVSKGNLLPIGFDEILYFKDKYYVHNEIHYFILKHGSLYGLYHLKRNLLWNNFDWDDYKVKDGFDYLFYKKGDTWYSLDLYKLKASKTEKMEFKERIRS